MCFIMSLTERKKEHLNDHSEVLALAFALISLQILERLILTKMLCQVTGMKV
jgi:hypothetical protein